MMASAVSKDTQNIQMAHPDLNQNLAAQPPKLGEPALPLVPPAASGRRPPAEWWPAGQWAPLKACHLHRHQGAFSELPGAYCDGNLPLLRGAVWSLLLFGFELITVLGLELLLCFLIAHGRVTLGTLLPHPHPLHAPALPHHKAPHRGTGRRGTVLEWTSRRPACLPAAPRAPS